MPTITSLRSNRLSHLRPDTGKQYVAFRLGIAWFILPIASIYRLMPIEENIPKLTALGQNVPLIDLGRSLFGQTKVNKDDIPKLSVGGAIVSSKPSIIIIHNKAENFVGLLSNSQPAMLQVTEDEIVALPKTYSQRWKVDFISSMTLPLSDRPSLFLIDSDRLIDTIQKKQSSLA
ncbi:MAG: chemotaxis protein CheW [Pseudanabaena sp. ELA645]